MYIYILQKIVDRRGNNIFFQGTNMSVPDWRHRLLSNNKVSVTEAFSKRLPGLLVSHR